MRPMCITALASDGGIGRKKSFLNEFVVGVYA